MEPRRDPRKAITVRIILGPYINLSEEGRKKMKNEQSSESQVDNLRDGTYLRIGKKIIPSIPEINTVECKHNIYFDARCKL